MTQPVFIYATFPDIASARKTGRMLVENRLAACVNILDGMVSVYRWEGAIAEDDEVVMIAKTRSDRVAAVTSAITDEHPYDEPAVVALPIVGGSDSFCRWIVEESNAQG